MPYIDKGGGGGSSTLSGLTDTTITTPASGDDLIYNGSKWVNDPESSLNKDFFNGTIVESFDALISDGGTIICTLDNAASPGTDLNLRFSDGLSAFSVPDTVNLTAGTATSPQENFIYILQSTKALTASTSGWPNAEHIKICYTLVQASSDVSSRGALITQNWNDHRAGSDNMGHMAHMAERSRRMGAIYSSGCALTTNADASPQTDLYLTVAAGVLYQMHKHTYASVAMDGTGAPYAHIVNDSVAPYVETNNLNSITLDATGASLANKYFNIVVWGVANKSGEYTPLMVNLPTGSYNNLTSAQDDTDSTAVYTIPDAFEHESSTGFLIGRLVVQTSTGTTNYRVHSNYDLRGIPPHQAIAGGVALTTTEFADNQFKIFDDGDVTKEIAFEASGITTGNTRTLTVQDTDGTLITDNHLVNSALSDPAFHSSGTWITGGDATTTKPHHLIEPSGTTSTGWSTNGTGLGINAASGSTGNLLDLQVNGSSRFKVPASGSLFETGGHKFQSDANALTLSNSSGTRSMIIRSDFTTIPTASSYRWGNLSSFASDLVLERDDANILALRRLTNAQTFRVYNTYTNSTNYERAYIKWDTNELIIGTEKDGTGTARAMALQTDGTDAVEIDTSQNVTVSAGDIVFNEKADHTSTPAAGKGYLWTKNTTPSSLIFTDDAGTDTDLTEVDIITVTSQAEQDALDTTVTGKTIIFTTANVNLTKTFTYCRIYTENKTLTVTGTITFSSIYTGYGILYNDGAIYNCYINGDNIRPRNWSSHNKNHIKCQYYDLYSTDSLKNEVYNDITCERLRFQTSTLTQDYYFTGCNISAGMLYVSNNSGDTYTFSGYGNYDFGYADIESSSNSIIDVTSQANLRIGQLDTASSTSNSIRATSGALHIGLIVALSSSTAIEGNTHYINESNILYEDGVLENRYFTSRPILVSQLASGVAGMRAVVSDANSPSIGSTVTGGGSSNAEVWYNGTNWTVTGV